MNVRYLTCLLVLVLTSWCSGQSYVAILLDDSGSMAEPLSTEAQSSRMDVAKRELLAVLSSLNPQTQVGLLTLNTQVDQSHWIVPLGPIDQDRLRTAIASIEAEGGTPLGESMKHATDGLLAVREKNRFGDYRLLIITDGEANDPELVDAYLPEILQRTIRVEVIGVDMNSAHSLAGRVDRYVSANDPNQLREAVAESLAETPQDDSNPQSAADFELLRDFPLEVAEATIAGLSQFDNRPIGEAIERDAQAFTPFGQPVGPDGTPPAEEGGNALPGFVIFLLILTFLGWRFSWFQPKRPAHHRPSHRR